MPPPPFTLPYGREADGRWIAEVRELPGVCAYGPDRARAKAAAVALALHVIADRIEHGEASDDVALPLFQLPLR